MELVGSQRDLPLRTHSDDLTAAEQFARQWTESQSQRGHIEVLADDSIPPGGAVVSFGNCTLDATLQTQLDRLAAEIVPTRYSKVPSPADKDLQEHPS